jgi:TPR repeat protein
MGFRRAVQILLAEQPPHEHIRSKIYAVYVILLLTYMMFIPGCASVSEIDASLERSAIKGDRKAQYEIGMHYYRARYAFFGKASYWEDAARWFEMAASQGDQRAYYRLAQYYFTVRSDYSESFKRLQLSAQDGIAEAQHFLGMHYAQAWGTPQDPVLAYKWIALAFEGGVQDPIGKLADLDWLVRRGKLTSDQIDEGQRLASDHTAIYGKSRSIEFME